MEITKLSKIADSHVSDGDLDLNEAYVAWDNMTPEKRISYLERIGWADEYSSEDLEEISKLTSDEYYEKHYGDWKNIAMELMQDIELGTLNDSVDQESKTKKVCDSISKKLQRVKDDKSEKEKKLLKMLFMKSSVEDSDDNGDTSEDEIENETVLDIDSLSSTLTEFLKSGEERTILDIDGDEIEIKVEENEEGKKILKADGEVLGEVKEYDTFEHAKRLYNIINGNDVETEVNTEVDIEDSKYFIIDKMNHGLCGYPIRYAADSSMKKALVEGNFKKVARRTGDSVDKIIDSLTSFVRKGNKLEISK